MSPELQVQFSTNDSLSNSVPSAKQSNCSTTSLSNVSRKSTPTPSSPVFRSSSSEFCAELLSKHDVVAIHNGYDCDYLENDYIYRYTLFDKYRNIICYAMEDDVHFCDRLDERNRSFNLNLMNHIGDICIIAKRTMKCIEKKSGFMLGPYCRVYKQNLRDLIMVKTLMGDDIGSIKQCQNRCGRPIYTIFVNDQSLTYLILGSRLPWKVKKGVFDLRSTQTNKSVGRIIHRSKQHKGLVTKELTDKDLAFAIEFRSSLDGSSKIMLLVASFLINCMYYVDQKDQEIHDYDSESQWLARIEGGPKRKKLCGVL